MTSPDPKLLERILDEFQDLIILIDAKTFKVQYLNDKMAQSLGKTKHELLGKNILKFFPPNVAKKRKEMALKVIQTKKPVFFDDQRLQRWFRNSYYPLFDKKGEVIYGLTIVQDITKQKQSDLDLENSEQRYKNLVNNLNDGVFTLDEKGNFIYVNDTIIRRSGISADKWKHIDLYKLVYPQYHKKIDESIKLLFAGKKVPPFELAYKTKDNRRIYVEINARAIIEGNKIKKIHAITRDITDKKNFEEALIASEKKYRQLIDLMQDAVFTLDNKGKVTYINKVGKERSGIPADKWSNIKFYNVVPPKYLKLWNMNFDRVLAGEQVPPFIVSYKSTHNKVKFVELNIGPLYGEGNNIIGVTGISRDVTDRALAEKELKDTKNYLQTVVDSTSDIIFVIDSDKRLKTWNKTAERITGYKAKPILGKKIYSKEIFVDPRQIETIITDAIQHKPLDSHELLLNTFDGEHRLISFSSSILKGAESQSDAVLFTGHDITEQSRVHKRLKFGQGYLIIEDELYENNYLFENLMRDGDNGLYITRFPHHKTISHSLDTDITYAYLTKNKAINHSSPTVESLDKLSSTIIDFVSTNRNAVVMLDRLDYLISLYSFEKVLQSIYQIHDEIHHYHGLFLVKTSRKILSDSQQALLFEELLPLPDKRIESIEISEKLFEILQFIEIRLSMNEQITFNKIEKSMHISKVTTRKRLLELEKVGLIFVKKRGRVKVLQLTNSGKLLLQKRKMV